MLIFVLREGDLILRCYKETKEFSLNLISNGFLLLALMEQI